ncbi:hypothetical protein CAPTEDRAFT_155045 [Capitella teleta]|uniref:SET domain-containing protein n=1 Tax=Capitella teleta TaxID=283909 RepID=X1Z7A0_CAPTE|nr:hypothetical protein CAPTEDRAFT_155045 [Capitella teleta]|eukprot:ELU04644.1 hypothetical protein CAPTEDRAFT_155045 [Capitella teleta]
MRAISTWWKQYKYRFVPWIALTLKDRSVRAVPSCASDELISNGEIRASLQNLFSQFNQDAQSATSYKSALHAANLGIMKSQMGFKVIRKPSRLKGGGTGVFVADGIAKKGTVVAMYPGAIYALSDPIFFQSLGNPFIFRCIDGILIDGNDKNLSKFLFKSCANRDYAGRHAVCDTSWLTESPVNPLAIGQYVNNHNKEHPANVAYQEYDFPLDFPLNQRKYIPNVFHAASIHYHGVSRLCRTVVLISTRDIQEGEELFSTYFTVVNK